MCVCLGSGCRIIPMVQVDAGRVGAEGKLRMLLYMYGCAGATGGATERLRSAYGLGSEQFGIEWSIVGMAYDVSKPWLK